VQQKEGVWISIGSRPLTFLGLLRLLQKSPSFDQVSTYAIPGTSSQLPSLLNIQKFNFTPN
jgi:hypothetical protein